MASIGLELALSLNVLNLIMDYWGDAPLIENKDFQMKICSNAFKNASANSRTYSYYDHSIKVSDALYQSRFYDRAVHEVRNDICSTDGG